MKKWLVALIAIALVASPVTAVGAVKSGDSCKKAGVTATANGKKFTCIKSGKKFVWNKGVAIKKPTPTPTPTPTPSESRAPGDLNGLACNSENQVVNNSVGQFKCLSINGGLQWSKNSIAQPTSTPTPTATPTPTPTPEVQLPVDGTLCTVIGEKVSNSTGTMRCSWAGHSNTTEEARQRLIWRKFVVAKTSTSQSNNYERTPVENASCANSGDTFDVPGGVLECRWIAGKQRQWIKINTVKKTFTNAKSPVSIDECKLQMSASKADRTGRNSGGGMVGFPLVDSERNGMKVRGTNEVLFVPIDFPDFPGGSGLKEQLEYDKKWMIDWYDYFSGGQSKFNVTTIDRWLRMPKDRSSYPTNAKNINAGGNDSNQRQRIQAQPFIDEISKQIDLRKFSTVYVFYPDGEYALGDFIIRNQPFNTKEGEHRLNFFSWGRNLEGMETLKWAYYIHETLHDFNIIGHAPGNGWGLGVMTGQSGISYVLNPWEQFVLGWSSPDQIYCDDAATLKSVTLSLSPLEREDQQTKMAVIKLSPTKAIVIESHGIDKWSKIGFGDRLFPPGFYSVMAYVVDLDKQTAAPTNEDSSSPYNDEWAWAVWQKVAGGRSNEFNTSVGDRKILGDYVAVLGDSFVIEGVRIKVVGTGDYETIEISKA